jgi:hypothetical protein
MQRIAKAIGDMHGHWSVLGLNRGRGQFFSFFRWSNDIIMQKVYFSWLMRVCIGLSNQSTFINEQLQYTPLVISRNDKNKQLTVLSQRKLELTAIHKVFAL